MISNGPVRPIVKWAGGKQALAPVLVDAFPEDYGTYFEPFLGGASVFLAASPTQAIVGDMNGWLIDTYRAVRDDWRAVARVLDSLVNTRQEFLRIRAIPPTSLPIEIRAAHFIYLNKTCFRGLFRVNRKDQFNVPYGAYNRRYYSSEGLSSFSARLQGIDILWGDFELSLDRVAAGDFVYLDPPYYKLGGYSDFSRYTAGQFRECDHLRLAALCRELDSRGVLWAQSNSDTEYIRCLYDGFQTMEVPESARDQSQLVTAQHL